MHQHERTFFIEIRNAHPSDKSLKGVPFVKRCNALQKMVMYYRGTHASGQGCGKTF